MRIRGAAADRGDRANAAVGLAVGSPVRTQSAGVSPTSINLGHYSAVYSLVAVRTTNHLRLTSLNVVRSHFRR